MGKLTISMAIFNSYVKLPEGKCPILEILNITKTSICWRLYYCISPIISWVM